MNADTADTSGERGKELHLALNPNDAIVRIELSGELMFNLTRGEAYDANTARLTYKDESGKRPVWRPLLKGPLVSIGGKKPGECSYADLLAGLARIFEAAQ